MILYWTINGEPACQSDLTCDDRLQPPTRCAYRDRADLLSAIERFLALYPTAVVEIVEGRCHAQDDSWRRS